MRCIGQLKSTYEFNELAANNVFDEVDGLGVGVLDLTKDFYNSSILSNMLLKLI